MRRAGRPGGRSARSITVDSRRLLVTLGVLAGLSATLTLVGWSWTSRTFDSRIEDGVHFGRAVTDAHEAMLDQETGLRAYAVTGDRRLLEPYDRGLRAHGDALARAWSLRPSGSTQRGLEQVRVAASRWQLEHAAPLIGAVGAGRPVAADDPRWASGDRAFDAYRAPQARLLRQIRQHNDTLLAQRRRADGFVTVAVVVLAVASLGAAGRRRRTMLVEVVTPIAEVRAVLDRLAAGDGTARVGSLPSRELQALATSVDGLAEAAGKRARSADAERDAVRRREEVYRRALHVANDLSAYLEERDLAEALVRALRDVVHVDTAVLQRLSDGRLGEVLAASPEGCVLPLDATTSEAVRFLRPVTSPDGESLALPVVHSGKAHALLRVRRPGGVDDDTELAVRNLALAAGGALTAAALHQAVQTESRTDALTGLRNRRRFEEDLEHELGLAARTGQPVSLVLIDVDHFKRFNDTRGHRAGDALLHDLGSLLTLTLRATDSAYRYGGEELALLLRGTGLDDAADLARRVRGVVAARTDVTVSLGVATACSPGPLPGPDRFVELVDGALYRAKAAGRDTVCVAADSAPAVPLARQP